MKSTRMLAILVLIACLVVPAEADPMGTAWTYQGRLMDANKPTDGLYDFQFKLFDDANTITGNQVGGDVNKPDIDVIDGYFTVELAFGSDVFDGNAVWLEIDVRPGDSNDPNAFITLSPRKEVTPTPYALQMRGIFVDKAKNVGVGTTSPTGKLHVEGGKAGAGADGGDIMIAAEDGGDGELLPGDGGNGGHIILLPGEGGEPGGFGVRGRDGSVGIGTDRPAAKLDVRGNISVDDRIKAYDSGGLTLATDDGVARLAIDDSGNVGIGTTSPTSKLEVMATANEHGIRSTVPRIAVYGHRTGTSGTWPGVHGECDSLSDNASGVRGVITSTSPGTNSAGVRGINNGTGTSGIGVWGSQDGSGWGVYGTSVDGTGVYGYASDSGAGTNYGGYFEAEGENGRGVYGTVSGPNGIGVYGKASGTDGIGVYGEASNIGIGDVFNYGGYFIARGEDGSGVYATATGSDGIGGRFKAEGENGEGVHASGPRYGVYGYGTGEGGEGVRGAVYYQSGKGVVGEGGSTGYDFYADGPGADYGSSSSIRWKRNIQAIDNPLDKILQLRGVYFDWDAEHGGGHDVGMIAEEVGEVLPEIVQYEEDGTYTSGMDYSKLTPLLVEAVKALKIEVNKLQEHNAHKDNVIDTLKQQNDKLEGRLAALESSITTITVQLKGGGK